MIEPEFPVPQFKWIPCAHTTDCQCRLVEGRGRGQYAEYDPTVKLEWYVNVKQIRRPSQ